MKADIQTVGVELIIHKNHWRDYLELTKPDVTSLALFTTLAGFYLEQFLYLVSQQYLRSRIVVTQITFPAVQHPYNQAEKEF